MPKKKGGMMSDKGPIDPKLSFFNKDQLLGKRLSDSLGPTGELIIQREDSTGKTRFFKFSNLSSFIDNQVDRDGVWTEDKLEETLKAIKVFSDMQLSLEAHGEKIKDLSFSFKDKTLQRLDYKKSVDKESQEIKEDDSFQKSFLNAHNIMLKNLTPLGPSFNRFISPLKQLPCDDTLPKKFNEFFSEVKSHINIEKYTTADNYNNLIAHDIHSLVLSHPQCATDLKDKYRDLMKEEVKNLLKQAKPLCNHAVTKDLATKFINQADDLCEIGEFNILDCISEEELKSMLDNLDREEDSLHTIEEEEEESDFDDDDDTTSVSSFGTIGSTSEESFASSSTASSKSSIDSFKLDPRLYSPSSKKGPPSIRNNASKSNSVGPKSRARPEINVSTFLDRLSTAYFDSPNFSKQDLHAFFDALTPITCNNQDLRDRFKVIQREVPLLNLYLLEYMDIKQITKGTTFFSQEIQSLAEARVIGIEEFDKYKGQEKQKITIEGFSLEDFERVLEKFDPIDVYYSSLSEGAEPYKNMLMILFKKYRPELEKKHLPIKDSISRTQFILQRAKTYEIGVGKTILEVKPKCKDFRHISSCSDLQTACEDFCSSLREVSHEEKASVKVLEELPLKFRVKLGSLIREVGEKRKLENTDEYKLIMAFKYPTSKETLKSLSDDLKAKLLIALSKKSEPNHLKQVLKIIKVEDLPQGCLEKAYKEFAISDTEDNPTIDKGPYYLIPFKEMKKEGGEIADFHKHLCIDLVINTSDEKLRQVLFHSFDEESYKALIIKLQSKEGPPLLQQLENLNIPLTSIDLLHKALKGKLDLSKIEGSGYLAEQLKKKDATPSENHESLQTSSSPKISNHNEMKKLLEGFKKTLASKNPSERKKAWETFTSKLKENDKNLPYNHPLYLEAELAYIEKDLEDEVNEEKHKMRLKEIEEDFMVNTKLRDKASQALQN